MRGSWLRHACGAPSMLDGGIIVVHAWESHTWAWQPHFEGGCGVRHHAAAYVGKTLAVGTVVGTSHACWFGLLACEVASLLRVRVICWNNEVITVGCYTLWTAFGTNR